VRGCGSNSVDVVVAVVVLENSTMVSGAVVLRERGQGMVGRKPGNWRLGRGKRVNGELTPRPLYVFDLKEVISLLQRSTLRRPSF
jgi:hypothetical protein